MSEPAERDHFERVIEVFQAELVNVAVHMSLDSHARMLYEREICTMANKLRHRALTNEISWGIAAKQANETRNAVMDMMRSRSTPVGRAMAQKMKVSGRGLNEMVAAKMRELFGSGASFDRLTEPQKNKVYRAIVESAGKSNTRVNVLMRNVSHVGRGLIILSVGIAVYNIATADDTVAAAGQEIAFASAGIGGGIAGGAAAGLACGPGAPLCAGVGAFIGGALAAFGVSLFY